MNDIDYNNFIEAFNKIKGKKIYFVDKEYTYKNVRTPGGYDHLGPLPDVITREIDKIDFYVKTETIDKYNIEEILTAEKVYFTKEDANWAAAIKQREENKRNANRKRI